MFHAEPSGAGAVGLGFPGLVRTGSAIVAERGGAPRVHFARGEFGKGDAVGNGCRVTRSFSATVAFKASKVLSALTSPSSREPL